MKQEKVVRKPYLWEALLSFGFLIIVMGIGIAKYEANPHIPMLIGTLFSVLIAFRLGYSWNEIEKSMFDGIYKALQAIIILAIIGVLIGTWLLAGVVPSMIYYGLAILKPSIFLVATVIICSITSLATGTSWGTAGTIGIALMGISKGLGIPAPVAAGAIISGAYFGDKMSPLSDTTNLAPAVSGTDVFTHVKAMLPTTVTAYVIALVTFLILGFQYSGTSSDVTSITAIRDGLSSSFNISPLLLLPPLAVILAMAFKLPAIPGIVIGIIIGGIEGVIFQGADFGAILTAAYDGFTSETGVEIIDELLTAGGLSGMMYSISLTIIAMMFGGIMEKTNQLEVIVNKILEKVKSTGGLIATTVLTCIGSNATMPEQYISVVLPGRMYHQAYMKKGLHPKMLSSTLEGGGTVTSSLIPWNTCAAFLYSVLGVSAVEYAPYAVFNYMMPIVVIIFGFLGVFVYKLADDPDTVIGEVSVEE
ncbi:MULTISPECIES: Na+/H+ antiporter NhaC [unclassified Sedimentibacter]|uniref:Na+/H+ antiporter NhaC n=1 Tax=unclassified Sedimentibacter TaxID=2649220 RepID=UPI0027E15A52|nr:Na+/H+ antiporter NhaC [Sedimentibacter sp. MB35-C1]WMJ76198.1 Na+/H+ antiporter NhaC [Sedimentibacter sp. MB35-C1]